MGNQWFRRLAWNGSLTRRTGRERREQAGTVVDLPPGCELCREGALACQWFLLLSGAVAVTSGGRPAGTVTPGEWFGPTDPGIDPGGTDALLAATATAITAVRVLVFDRGEYQALGWLRPHIERPDDVRISAPLASEA
jgi:hypothetical protein